MSDVHRILSRSGTASSSGCGPAQIDEIASDNFHALAERYVRDKHRYDRADDQEPEAHPMFQS